MKVMILCGGLGTRMREETEFRPKPMVEIGGRPLLWHLMSSFAQQGFTDFVLCLGYKGEFIRDYFLNYRSRTRDFTIRLDKTEVRYHGEPSEPWTITLADTGPTSNTGGRVLLGAPYLGTDERFIVTYGDGLADIDVPALVRYHQQHGRLATVTGVHPPSRFGEILQENGRVTSFAEKPQASAGLINGGFFVFERTVLDYIAGSDAVLEREPLEQLAQEGQLMTYLHEGYWRCMDTPRDLDGLRADWNGGLAAWQHRR